MMSLKTLHRLSMAAFFATAIASYQGALRGLPWLGLAVCALCAAILLPWMGDVWRRMKLILLAAAVGALLDTLLIAVGIYTSADHTRFLLPAPLCPEWVSALWANFGMALYIYKDYLLSVRRGAISGVIYAVLIYANARRHGLVSMSLPVMDVAIISLLWAVLIPWLAKAAQRITRTETPSLAGGKKEQPTHE